MTGKTYPQLPAAEVERYVASRNDPARAALKAIADPDTLRRYLARAATAATSDEVFSGG